MGGINMKKPEAFEVQSMKIQCDIRRNRHIFQWISFLRLGKIFWSSCYLHHIHLKENGMRLF